MIRKFKAKMVNNFTEVMRNYWSNENDIDYEKAINTNEYWSYENLLEFYKDYKEKERKAQLIACARVHYYRDLETLRTLCYRPFLEK